MSDEERYVGREGIVTVWDEHGRYVGCLGSETWQRLLADTNPGYRSRR